MSLKNPARVILALGSMPAGDSAWSKVADALDIDAGVERVTILASTPLAARSESEQSVTARFISPSPDFLSSTPKSAGVVDLYAAFRRDEGYESFRFLALKLLNRKDFTGTLRFLEREVMLAGSVASFLQILDEEKPNLIVFPVTPHEFLQFVLYSIATWRGIPVLFFQPSPIAPAMMPRTSLEASFSPLEARISSSSVKAELAKVAREKLHILAEGLDPVYMQIQQSRDNRVKSWRHKALALKASVGWLFSERFPESIDLSGHGDNHGILPRVLKIALPRSLQRALRKRVNSVGLTIVPPVPYCLFALHYEPERTSLPEGLPIDFQGDALIAARALMPEDSTLVVKEHYSQQTSALRGFLGRSPQFYDLIQSFPHMVFAPTSARLSQLVDDAQCVFTLTGTVAIEAVLRGVPVAYFGSPWWEGLPGTLRIGPKVTFDDIVSQAMPSQEDVYAFFEKLTLDRMIPGLAAESIDTIEKRLGPLPNGFLDAEVSGIMECIRYLLDNKLESGKTAG